MALEPGQRIELAENYRNCERIARLALSFCVDDPASPCTKPPPNRPCAKTPTLVDYGDGCQWDFQTVVERLLKLADRDPSHLIGIITPDNDTRNRWLAALRQHPVQLDNGHPRIATYAANDQDGDHRFSQGGIFVINAQSAKGLEFDSVILADIERYRCNPKNRAQMDDIRRRFYVMVSRARDQVFLMRQVGRPCPVESILPTDKDILKPWR